MARAKAATRQSKWWELANSPFVLFLLGSVVVAGFGHWYTNRQAEIAEQADRKAELVKLVVELQSRVIRLSFADAKLNTFLGRGPNFEGVPPIPSAGPERERFEEASVEVGRLEEAIIRGTPPYSPTSPEYSGVSLLAIASRLEQTAGIPDVQAGAFRLLGLLEVEPDVLWLMVRSFMPQLTRYALSRHLMFTRGSLPFPRGHKLTAEEERALGFPEVKPGQLEALRRENEKLADEISAALREHK